MALLVQFQGELLTSTHVKLSSVQKENYCLWSPIPYQFITNASLPFVVDTLYYDLEEMHSQLIKLLSRYHVNACFWPLK